MKALIALGTAVVLGLYTLVGAAARPAAPAGRATNPAPQLRRGMVSALAAGKLLVAARTLRDPNFYQTVVLLIEFDRDGAMGLVVNRRTEVTLERLLPGLPAAQSSTALAFLGGPVGVSSLRALLRSTSAGPDAQRVLNGVYLLTTRDALDDVLSTGAGADRVRIYGGYAGWGAGQLQRETEGGSWHVFDGESTVVFDPDPNTTWQRQIRRTETLLVQFNRPVVRVIDAPL